MSALNFDDTDEHVITQSKLISLNSKYATDKLNGDKLSMLSFDFNNIASKDKDTLYHTIAIQSAEIPSSYYNVNDNNNKISIRETTAFETITIAEGNYDANSFAAAFKVAFEATFTYSATLSYNSTTGKYSLVSSQTNQSLTLNVEATTAKTLLGIPETATGTLDFPYSATPSYFPLPVNFLGVTKIKVASNALAGDNYDSASLNTTTLVDTLSTTAVNFGITIFNSLGRESYVKAKRIDEIDIQMRDQNNRLLDFNGVNWTMTIILNTHKRQLFSKRDGTINFDKLVRFEKAQEETETLKEELKDISFVNITK